MPDRQPDLMQRKVNMRKVIDLAKMSIKNLRKFLSSPEHKRNRALLKRMVGSRHYAWGSKMSALKKKKRNWRRNKMAKESRRSNRG